MRSLLKLSFLNVLRVLVRALGASIFLFSPMAALGNSLPSFCTSGSLEDTAASFWYALSQTRENCALENSYTTCPLAPPIWRADAPPIIDFANIDYLPDIAPLLKDEVRELVDRLQFDNELSPSILETREHDSEIGNVIIYVLNEQVISMMERGNWKELDRADFQEFRQGLASLTYRWSAFDQKSQYAAFIYILPDSTLPDLSLELGWQIVGTFGLNYAPAMPSGLTPSALDELVNQTTILYSLPENEIANIRGLEDAVSALERYCTHPSD
ncbi:hypothetical protein [Actibacterium sp. XHP0104]|uniref:hypothetical protein n=1 Tax=Actibacterium sp. XHP0104 TaxID=2984335 RepID=UPI0021E800D7|nr:hypothetical protein [Actibacterium sp. XHP0104]MCV2882155.1 hypothetical protein [Actibacterium sp. XHP0104]